MFSIEETVCRTSKPRHLNHSSGRKRKLSGAPSIFSVAKKSPKKKENAQAPIQLMVKARREKRKEKKKYTYKNTVRSRGVGRRGSVVERCTRAALEAFIFDAHYFRNQSRARETLLKTVGETRSARCSRMENLKRAVVEPRARTDNANAVDGSSRERGREEGKHEWKNLSQSCI